jgi:transposase-like protein
VIHSQKERRYQCKSCRRTFTETRDTPFYRMHKPKWLVVAAVTLVAHGGPRLPTTGYRCCLWHR